MKKITVVVPIYNALDDVKNLLESLLKNFDFKVGNVILLNDCSESQTAEYLEKFSRQYSEFKLINNEENLGFVKTCNKGMRLAETEFVVLLNSDTIIPQGFAQRIIECFESNPEIGLASPISSNSNAYYIRMRKDYTVDKMNDMIRLNHKSVYPMIPEAEGFCFCIRKKVIEQQGYLDEIYGKGYHEEVDFSYRAITNGWKIVLIDNLWVYHKRQASFGELEREKLISQNDEVFYSRWRGFRQKYKEDNNLINPVIEIEQKVFKPKEKKTNDFCKINNKILVHLHLHYHDQLDYMISKLKNINDCKWDLYVTVCEINPKSEKKILDFKKDAKIIKVENKGYDVWPFIQVLRMVNIDDYDSVLKIHTKNYSKFNLNFIGIKFNGWFWRNSLVDALLGSKKIFKKNKLLLENNDAGIIFDDNFKLPLSKYRPEDSSLLIDFKIRLKIESYYKYFCAGTMFMIKACILKRLIDSNIGKEDFEKDGYTSDRGKLVHSFERIFTLLTDYEGYNIITVKKENKKSFFFKPKFSFIMPTYNRAFCIVESIESLLAQTNQKFELIIIDDGSSDNTKEILFSKFSQEIKNKKIRYFKLKTNKGVSFARNIGLKKAKNQWIAYLDSDNILDKDFVEEFSKAIEDNKEKEVFYSKFKTSSGIILGEPFDYKELTMKNFIDMGVFVHKKSLVRKYGGFDIDLKRLVDWDLIVRYTTNCRPVFIDKNLMYYNAGEHTRISNTEDKEFALNVIKMKFLRYLDNYSKYLKIINKLNEKNKKKRKVVFWGASLFLEMMLEEDNLEGFDILGIVDRNKTRQGTYLKGYKIYSPESLGELKPDCVFFAIINHSNAYRQVKEYMEKNYPDIELMSNIFE